jgi:hypothetical protein
MSTPLSLSLGRSTAIAVTLLALSGVTHAADIPASQCVSQKLYFASLACDSVFGVGDDPAAIKIIGETLASEWSGVEQQNTDCAQSAPTSDAVLSDITSAASNIASSIDAGIDPSCKVAVGDVKCRLDAKCRSLFVGYAGGLCLRVLATDRLAAKSRPQKKLIARRRSRVMHRFSTQWASGVCSIVTTPDADTIVSAMNALENAIVTDILTPAP